MSSVSSPGAPTLPEVPPLSRWQRARRWANEFIHHPATELVIMLLIVISVGLMIAEIAVSEYPAAARILDDANWGITIVFAIELSIRFWVARKKRRFFASYWVDILALLPLVRPLRFFRVFRLLRIFRAGTLMNRRLSVFRGMFAGSASELTFLAAVTLTLVLAAAMVLHFGEVGNEDFDSFPEALWFALYSLVGGEPIGGSPSSEMGRWATLVLMIGGLTVFGMFVGTVSATMSTRLAGRLTEVNEMDLDELSGHVVVCGWNGSGVTVLRELFGPGTPRNRAVVILTEDPEQKPDLSGEEGVRIEHLYFHHGDYTRTEVLEEVGIRSASTAILLTDRSVARSNQDRDARTVLAALLIEKLAPGIYTIAELTSKQSESVLRMAGVEEIVVGDWYAGVILGSTARNRGLVHILDEVLSLHGGNAIHTVRAPEGMAPTTVGALHDRLLNEQSAVLIAVEGREGRVVVNPPLDTPVLAGDYVTVLSRAQVSL